MAGSAQRRRTGRRGGSSADQDAPEPRQADVVRPRQRAEATCTLHRPLTMPLTDLIDSGLRILSSNAVAVSRLIAVSAYEYQTIDNSTVWENSMGLDDQSVRRGSCARLLATCTVAAL